MSACLFQIKHSWKPANNACLLHTFSCSMQKSTLSLLPLVTDLIAQCDDIHASIPSLKSCIMSSAVSKALSIVVRMTPTGPVFTQPLQYRPAKEWNTTVQAEVEDSLVCLCGVRCVCVCVFGGTELHNNLEGSRYMSNVHCAICPHLGPLHSLGREGEETEKKAVKIVDIS